MRLIMLACAVLCAWTTQSSAKPVAPVIECDMRGCRTVQIQPDRPKHHQKAKRDRQSAKKVYAAIRSDANSDKPLRITDSTERIVDHPEGCPRSSFCGCGVAVKVFGKPVRELWLAANWFKFRRTDPAPGMVAVRSHHVFVIVSVVSHGTVLAYDPNSGGHKTRIHLRSLAGYRVVDPRSG